MNEHYSREIKWSEEDGCYVGRCPELFLGGCHGDNEEQVRQQLDEIIADVIKDYLDSGKSLPEPAVRSPRFTSAGAARKKTGLSQRNFARAIGVGLSTVRNWEQGRIVPKGASATLLKIVERRPEVLRDII